MGAGPPLYSCDSSVMQHDGWHAGAQDGEHWPGHPIICFFVAVQSFFPDNKQYIYDFYAFNAIYCGLFKTFNAVSFTDTTPNLEDITFLSTACMYKNPMFHESYYSKVMKYMSKWIDFWNLFYDFSFEQIFPVYRLIRAEYQHTVGIFLMPWLKKYKLI